MRFALFIPLLFLIGASATARAEEPYPARIATIEQMKVTSGPMQLKLPKATTKRSTLHTVVIVSHVAPDGSVLRSKIEQSSGAPKVDEIALRAMLDVRFAPYIVNGSPEEVSVVIPMRIPAADLVHGR